MTILTDAKIDLVDLEPNGDVIIRFLKRMMNSETGQVIEGWHRTLVRANADPLPQLKAVNAHFAEMGLPAVPLKPFRQVGVARREGRAGRVFERDRRRDKPPEPDGTPVDPALWKAAVEKAFPERRREVAAMPPDDGAWDGL